MVKSWFVINFKNSLYVSANLLLLSLVIIRFNHFSYFSLCDSNCIFGQNLSETVSYRRVRNVVNMWKFWNVNGSNLFYRKGWFFFSEMRYAFRKWLFEHLTKTHSKCYRKTRIFPQVETSAITTNIAVHYHRSQKLFEYK